MLEDTICIVCGAGHGLGEETVARTEAAGGDAVAHFGDVTGFEYTESLVAEAYAKFGRVDTVANFAGVLRDRMLFNMSEEE
jgi:NAD(P)-dependent dehydrogenase (short-subunit alcohol dehydrogenase family)